MKKKKQPKDINTLTAKGKRSKVVAASVKIADDGWKRLMKIREELAKADTPDDEVTDRLTKIGEEIGKDWQSEKSAVEILSEMRR